MKYKNTENMKNILKRCLMAVSALLCVVTGALAQRSYTFNAVALNVDGLPEKISGVTVNEGAPGIEGATLMGNAIAKQNWDIVAFSEDFDYHSYLVAPLTDYYHIGTWRGAIDLGVGDIIASNSADTDGLGLLVAKRNSTGYTGETCVPWSTYNGYTDQGADGLIKKGFRYYAVTIASGIVVDVYILHMDADSGDKDITARNNQLTQLATYIKNNKHGRPILIIGDTNCRYTRDAVKTNLIDAINADSRLTIKDAWIEKMWGGEYPVLGADAMMWYNAPYDNNTGEIVDKIFYINDSQSSLTIEANSYLHNTSFGVSDHYPVIVNFTITDLNGTPIDKEDSWTLEESTEDGQKPTWEGEQVVSGTTYYLMNVGTGKYVKVGASLQTQATSGYAGTPITVTALSDGKYALQSLGTSRGNYMTAVEYPFMDGLESESHEWELTPIATSSSSYQYYIEGGNGVLTTTTETGNVLKTVAKNTSDENQKWVFLTDARIRTEMTKASADYPFNFTPLLKSADFDKLEHEAGYASSWSGFTFGGVDNGADATTYNHVAIANSTSAVTASHALGTLPKGTYNVSFEGFYRSQYTSWFTTKDETLSGAVVSFGSTNISIPNNQSISIGTATTDVAALFRDSDDYLASSQVSLSSEASISLSVTKPATSSSAKAAWVCIDNFRLMYYGTGEVTVDPYKEYKAQVVAKVNETYLKVLELNEAGQAAYDISTVIYRYNNNMVTSQAIADALCAMVDEAYANAYAAHCAYIVQQAILNMDVNGGDITSAIINNSFEMGNLFGWTIGSGWDVAVWPNSNGTYTADGCDGDYLFNSYAGDDDHTSYVKQTIRGIPNGLYELKAQVTSFEGRYVYLIGNGYNDKVATENGKTVFHEATLYFLVEGHTATIGAVGGNKGGGSTFIHYWPWEGCFFKADNFRLKYICDVPHGRLKLALDEANNATLDAYGKAALDISSYQTMYDNKSLTTDGKTEAAAVYTALRSAAKAQRIAGTDMTWAITNPNFETGDYTGWSTTVAWDTGVKPQENGTYTVAGTDGRYLFNTWNNADGATNSGVNAAITQTVTGLPNGTYKLTAMVATDSGNSMKLTGNGTTTTIAASTKGASSGVFPEVECTVSDGTLAITVEGENSCWYKCDDFHLTLVIPAELVLNETDNVIAEFDGTVAYPKVKVNRTLKAKTKLEEGVEQKPLWNSFVVPFDIPANMLEGWEVKELESTSTSEDGKTIYLKFKDAANGIKVGVSYMVRNKSMETDLESITMENVTLNTTSLTTPSTDHIEFIGTYTNGYVPAGDFFISNNTFYKAAKAETNRLKGFRSYFRLKTANARSLSFRTGEEDDETAIVPAASDVTVVAIYNTNGMRLDDFQDGINILLLSDGTTMKVIIN